MIVANLREEPMSGPELEGDFEKAIRAYITRVFDNLSGLVVSGLIYLGYHLGLYRALQDAGPVTSEELARKTGLHERWVREWLRGQAAAGLLDHVGNERFEMSAIAALALANEQSPAFVAGAFGGLPQQMDVLVQLLESFKTGIGLPYDAVGVEGARGVEGMCGPWFRTMLVPIALPALDGVVLKLEAGAKVGDIGCGTGVALVEMAKAFPRSQFHGYEISRHALSEADKNKSVAGVGNLTFHDAEVDRLPEDASFDFITAFDCIHDMTHPAEALTAMRRSIKGDGTCLVVDINAKPTFEENVAENPMAAMMYGFSVLTCLSSALSHPEGAGLGTLGFSEPVARQMTSAAGFTHFRRVEIDNPINAFYELRP
jgi:2-polyprenyl-3-methyl-5-hydroxy-6-metoxy-1,4-benzoquinol methylase